MFTIVQGIEMIDILCLLDVTLLQIEPTLVEKDLYQGILPLNVMLKNVLGQIFIGPVIT